MRQFAPSLHGWPRVVLFVATLCATHFSRDLHADDAPVATQTIEEAISEAMAEPSRENIIAANDRMMNWTRPTRREMQQRLHMRAKIVALALRRMEQTRPADDRKPALNLAPSGTRNFTSGQDPAAITDPRVRERYQQAIAANESLADARRDFRQMLEIAERGVWLLDIESEELYPEPSLRRDALKRALAQAGLAAPAVQWLFEKWSAKRERMRAKPAL